jgi:hypothetical protein
MALKDIAVSADDPHGPAMIKPQSPAAITAAAEQAPRIGVGGMREARQLQPG